MAYDKAVDSAALDAGLTAIANAIREKAGSSDALAFPDAMAAAIAAIEAGGGGVALPTGVAMECGVYIPAENDTDTVIIYTNNTYKWNTQMNHTTFAAFVAIDIPAGTASMLAGLAFYDKNRTKKNNTYAVNASETIGTYSGYCGFSSNGSSNNFRIPATAAYPLVAGVSYFYIVVGEVV